MPTGRQAPFRCHTRPTKFSLAATTDPELIPALDAYPVDEVTANFPGAVSAVAVPAHGDTNWAEADLRSYIRLLDRHGLSPSIIF